jgi:hypothetical protein
VDNQDKEDTQDKQDNVGKCMRRREEEWRSEGVEVG